MRTPLLSALVAVTVALAAGFAGAARTSDSEPMHPAPGGTVFVTERSLLPGSVSALDAASGRPIWTARTGLMPIGVVKPRGTHKVYTSDESSNQMSVFDMRTGALLTTIPMGGGRIT